MVEVSSEELSLGARTVEWRLEGYESKTEMSTKY
jgi:hypothetical protein